MARILLLLLSTAAIGLVSADGRAEPGPCQEPSLSQKTACLNVRLMWAEKALKERKAERGALKAIAEAAQATTEGAKAAAEAANTAAEGAMAAAAEARTVAESAV